MSARRSAPVRETTRALAAFDKFKDALSAREACEAARQAIAAARPDWLIETAPLADGGDGFCETLCLEAGGRIVEFEALGPLGEPRTATLGLCELARVPPQARALLDLPAGARSLGILELAATSGIALVAPENRSPWRATTYGLGQAAIEAEARGADALLAGLGGSASHDLGCGALQALGFRFLDARGAAIEGSPIPAAWDEIAAIRLPDRRVQLPLRVARDVDNPLLGPRGAAAVFGPQKGLKPGAFDELERRTRRIAALLREACGAAEELMDAPGAGAAGGAAFGLAAGLGGKLLPGAELVFAWVGLEEKLARADIVLTGEGRFDASSLGGKGPGALLRRAAALGKEAWVFAGSVGALPEAFPFRERCFGVTPKDMPPDRALPRSRELLFEAIRREMSFESANRAEQR